jgi:nicotinamide mononucleotide transporter
MIEAVATFFALGATWCSLKQNIHTWPLGIVAVCLYIIIFWQVQLYAEVGLQMIYIVLQAYGWRNWLSLLEKQPQQQISRLSYRQWSYLLLIGVLATLLLSEILLRYTDSDVVYWDVTTTVFSLLALWLMARKYIETWWLWFVIDFTYVGLFAYKQLYLTAGLNVIYLSLAIYGFLCWRRELYKSMVE